MAQLFDTHKFLFTLNHEGRIRGHSVLFVDRDGKDRYVILDKVDIGTSPIKCKIFDVNGERYVVPFLKIKKVFLEDILVWETDYEEEKKVKIIKGYERGGN